MKNPIFSIITINRNNVTGLKKTLDSLVSQTCRDFEHIIIDGASTDGSVDVIKEYVTSSAGKNVSYWVSEPDSGIYYAMNKGIEKANGEWINFMNSGDTFFNAQVLEKVKTYSDTDADILFGDSIECDNNCETAKICSEDSNDLFNYPIYRHEASFVRTSVHKNYLFDLSKTKLGFALDYNCIYSMKRDGKKFKKINTFVLKYEKEGISSQNMQKVFLYNYRITKEKKPFRALTAYIYNSLNLRFPIFSKIYIFLPSVYHYLMNHIINHIPLFFVRKFFYKITGMKIGKSSKIDLNQYILFGSRLSIGAHCHINQSCFIDARGKIFIHDNVSISHFVKLVTGSHDIQSQKFDGKFLPIEINDNAWIGINATILQGVKIGKGAVICAGAVVTKDVKDYEIVAGIPATVIGKRNDKLNYVCTPEGYFF